MKIPAPPTPGEEFVNQFSVKGKRTKHQKSVHIGIRHQCEQCASLATTKDGLTKHLHMRIKHTCEECAQPFTNKQSLTVHLNNVTIRL